MSNKELERYHILCAIKDKQLTQIKGAELLKLSTRQIRNLLKEFKLKGPKGLISKKRGKPSNRRYNLKLKREVLGIINKYYEDYGPTLAKEQLVEKHQIALSTETLRSWMTEAHIWSPFQRKRNKHCLRKRRPCFGELIQIDGSHHDWFEGRREKCVLLVFIDDATSKLTSLYFSEGESLEAYFNTLEAHINKYGKPKELYSDRFSVFRSSKEDALTHFKHALKILDISHITATTPQAKGRVERANKTLQDRLVKEMRQTNICTIEEANEYLKGYMERYNSKFSKEPESSIDVHRPLETDLSRILSRYEERILSKNLSISFHNKTYQICEELPQKIKIEVREQRDGKIRLFYRDLELKYKVYDEQEFIEGDKPLYWPEKRTSKLLNRHPWKRESYQRKLKEKELAKWKYNYEKVV